MEFASRTIMGEGPSEVGINLLYKLIYNVTIIKEGIYGKFRNIKTKG